MRIVAVTIDALQIEGVPAYSVGQSTAHALLATTPYSPITVNRAGNYPWYVRSQIEARRIPLTVSLHDVSFDVRQAAYDALAAVLGPGEHDLVYTDDAANDWQLVVTAEVLLPTAFLNRATCELTAWNPTAVAV